MSFDLTNLLRYQPDEELTQREIKDLKDGVPNYPGGWVEVQGPNPLHEHMCGECTGSGVMLGYYPCRPCGGTGYIVPEPLANPLDIAVAILDQFEKQKNRAFMDLVETGRAIIYKPPLEDIKKAWQKIGRSLQQDVEAWRKSFGYVTTKPINTPYPNERELSLLNTRIAKLKAQLSKELQKKKAERNQFEINQIHQSINTLTKWKTPNKNSTQTGY